jgi:hypothetical protein
LRNYCIRWANTIISAREGRSYTDTPKQLGASREGSTPGMFEAFTAWYRVRKRWPSLRVSQASNKQAPSSKQALRSNFHTTHFVHLLREAKGEAEVFVVGSMHLQGNHSSCFVVRTKARPNEHTIILSTSRRNLLRQPLNPPSQKRCSIHHHTVHLLSHSMFNLSYRSQG